MNLDFTPEENAFRDEVRTFIKDNYPAELRKAQDEGRALTKEEYLLWHKVLAKKGWVAPSWPKELGGTDWTPTQKYIWSEETARADCLGLMPFGLSMLAPVLYTFGTDEQKKRFLPGIYNGEDWWCQGYSEPGSGSDLASVKTTAVLDGDHYVVNGQKTWTTLGHFANMIFCLVRTNREAKAQSGISFLLVDMNTPGVEVRPIITLDGDHEVNEVFFTDVRVPAENLVGEQDKGWTYAKYLLTYERTNIAGVGYTVAALEKVKRIAMAVRRNRRPLIEDPIFASRLVKLEIDLENMKTTNLRVIAAVAGGGAPGAESSMLKIRGTEIRQELLSLARRAIGPYAQPFVEEALLEGYAGDPIGPQGSAALTAQYLNNRKLSIYGGSNEIQRNIISKMILGL